VTSFWANGAIAGAVSAESCPSLLNQDAISLFMMNVNGGDSRYRHAVERTGEVSGTALHATTASKRSSNRVLLIAGCLRRTTVTFSAAISIRIAISAGCRRSWARHGSATRCRRADIASFYRGSRAVPIGQSLADIQNRVLPVGATINGVRVVDDNTRVPLYLATAGWLSLSVRAGLPLTERLDLLTAVENLLDRNYRFHGSGTDTPGINAYVRLRWRF
jgi:hypothetical protein